MRVLVEESHDVPLVEIVIAGRRGSASDEIGREGALNLAYRALRRGTAKRTATAIEEEIDRLGAAFGTLVDINGTNVHARVIRHNLDALLPLLADLVLRPRFSGDEIAQLLREIRADIIAARNDDRGLASRAFRRALFAGHPGGRPINGTLETIETLDRDYAEASYHAQLTRGNLVFGVAGDVDSAQITARLGEIFDAIPGGRAMASAPPDPAPPRGRHLLIVDKPDRTQTQIYIGGIGGDPFDPDFTALQVANVVFGGTFTARLMREVRSKRGWSYGASSRLGRDRGRDAWYMHTFPAATDAAACVSLQLDLLEDWVERGVSARELEFAKRFMTGSYAFDRETAVKRLSQRLDTELLPLPSGYFDRFVERVRSVTVDQANRAIRRRLSKDDLVIAIVATANELRPALEKAIPRLASTHVVPFDRDVIHREPIFPQRDAPPPKLRAARGRPASHASGS
jgi:zinc protease